MPIKKGAKTALARKLPNHTRLLLLAGLLLIAGAFVYVSQNSSNKEQEPNILNTDIVDYQFRNDTIGRIGDGYFNFELAKNSADRAKGLSGRSGLKQTDAIVFVFDEQDEYCFWMKDMKFNIDMLWFDEDYSMVHQQLNVSPSSYPTSYCPPQPAKYVVEVAAGVTALNQITSTSKLQFSQ